MSCVNHDSARGLVRRFQGNEGTRRRNIYMRLVERRRQIFGEEMKLSFLDFHNN
jgi:hypothetical protein